VAGVSGAAHYPFPPAAAYRLNRCLHAIKSDSAFCARFLADPRGAAAEMDLSEAEHAALSPLDRDALVRLGGHPYLVFMAELRLRMASDPAALEYF
jgi:Aromatic-ring-opening dioxygenase LigAB, LigA subunit